MVKHVPVGPGSPGARPCAALPSTSEDEAITTDHLIEPHGDTLVDPIVDDERDELTELFREVGLEPPLTRSCGSPLGLAQRPFVNRDVDDLGEFEGGEVRGGRFTSGAALRAEVVVRRRRTAL